MHTLLLTTLMFTFSVGADVAPSAPLVSTPEAAKIVDDEDASALQRHRPFYFAYGHSLSKVQLSFKTPLMRKMPVFFGYTQLMFWALNDDSKPFRDLTYTPEFFYRFNFEKFGLLKSLDFGLFNHNSNGKAASASRSYNQSYLRSNFEKSLSRWVVRVSAQLACLYGFDPDNRDLQDYVGPLSFGMSFTQIFKSWVDKSEVALLASPGGKFSHRWDRGGYQLSWSFRLGGFDIVPAFYMQYYRGYAETLLNYNRREDVFRGGLIF